VLRCESSRPGDWSFQSAQWRAARAIADRREHWCQPGRDAKAEAETLPFARHHDFAPMTSPTRVASHSTDRSQIGLRIKVDYCNQCLSSKIPLRAAATCARRSFL